MIDNVAAALLQSQRKAKKRFFGNTLCPAEFPQRFHGPHDLIRLGIQMQDHARFSVSGRAVLWPTTCKVRMAISSDCGALAAKARTFRSKPSLIAAAAWPDKPPQSVRRRSLP